MDDDSDIKIGDTVIENVDSYVYLGHKLKLGKLQKSKVDLLCPVPFSVLTYE